MTDTSSKPAAPRSDCGCDFAYAGGHEPRCPQSKAGPAAPSEPLPFQWEAVGMLVKTAPDAATNTGDEVRAYLIVTKHNEQLAAALRESEARCQAVTAERDALRAALANVWDAIMSGREALQIETCDRCGEVCPAGWCGVCHGPTRAEGLRAKLLTVADAWDAQATTDPQFSNEIWKRTTLRACAAELRTLAKGKDDEIIYHKK